MIGGFQSLWYSKMEQSLKRFSNIVKKYSESASDNNPFSGLQVNAHRLRDGGLFIYPLTIN